MTPDEQFVQAAIRRIYGWMFMFAGVPAAVLLVSMGWWYAAGFAVGAVLSILNFHWLKAGIEAVMNATGQGETPVAIEDTAAMALADGSPQAVCAGETDDPEPQPPKRRRPNQKGVVVRYVLRYALIVGVGYVIFRSSAVSLTAFLGGLFVFVAGVLAEMIFELVTGTGTTQP